MNKYVYLLSFILFSIVVNAQQIVRGPYLQSATPNSIKIMWRTDSATTSTINFGSTINNLSNIVTDTNLVTDHIVLIEGLSPKTKYYYAVSLNGNILAGNNEQHHFVTNPSSNDTSKVSFWVTGDFGAKNNDQISVKRWFQNYLVNNTVDAWLWLGDNTYDNGKDWEYQQKVFSSDFGYDSIFRFLPFYPIPGNHDYGSISRKPNPKNDAGPYYNIVEVPKNGEAGGIGSGTETYYSYDYGTAHFLALNSEPMPYVFYKPFSTELVNKDMYNFAIADLQASTKKFNIAYWHQPPYSKGSHDSDDGWELFMKGMREEYLPILEENGIDLILNGHSHVYERSFLINGHYNYSYYYDSTTMLIDGSSGNPDLGEAYHKKTYGVSANKGTVYAVVGNSGKKEGDNGEHHPVMFTDLSDAVGSMILTIEGNVLTASYYTAAGILYDKFQIIKQDTTIVNGIKPIASIEKINVYPNPSTQTLVLDIYAKQNDNINIDIFNINGSLIKSNIWTNTIYSGKNTINLTNSFNELNAGIYLLSITNANNGKVVHKVVKQ
ncbi:MAG: metallophosphoesterase [Chitinophagales bacterium]|nr:metallophosphoesterase [Chitinophagales bacterium]